MSVSAQCIYYTYYNNFNLKKKRERTYAKIIGEGCTPKV